MQRGFKIRANAGSLRVPLARHQDPRCRRRPDRRGAPALARESLCSWRAGRGAQVGPRAESVVAKTPPATQASEQHLGKPSNPQVNTAPGFLFSFLVNISLLIDWLFPTIKYVSFSPKSYSVGVKCGGDLYSFLKVSFRGIAISDYFAHCCLPNSQNEFLTCTKC